MYYLELFSGTGSWSNEIGEYNGFDTKDEAYEIISEYESECIKNSRGYDEDLNEFVFKWRVHNDEDYCAYVTNYYDSEGKVKL